ncbi:fasciclin domain-containing protein [Chitinophaga cymbidii]|nr:fasciclin domain-containing protein [Chitinophaga cymbidii]
MTRKDLIYPFMLALLLTSALITACKKNQIELLTTDDVNIVGYLEKYPDSFSLFKQILDRTETSAFLNAYGAYTCFAPTNSGVNAWLAKINAANVDAVDIEVLKNMVQFHLLTDTITTAAFKDGKLPVPTMFGQYLVTGVNFDGGASSYMINRQAEITRSNIRVGNGMIHQLNNVLEPSSLTIAKQLEAKPEYSVFVQALKETGFYDVLNTVDADTAKRWMTVIAESNNALADSGFASYAALKARYSTLGDPSNPNDSLHMYVAYHILGGVKFLGDIITSPSHQTFQPQEVISVQLINQNVIVNENEFNGIVEKGIALKRPSSDNAATNGVWHDADAHYSLKYRPPTAVYWEVSAFEEVMKLPAVYGKSSLTWRRETEADKLFKDIDWGWGSNAGTNIFTYSYSTSSSITRYAVHNDCNQLPLGLPARPIWWEMTTPPIVKGKYKIWICYARSKQSSSSNMLCQVSVNGEVMPRTFNFTDLRPKGSDSELEAIGWKQYTESRPYASDSNYAAKLVGTYEFLTTQRQTIRITPLSGTQNNNFLDMIHFIPIDENQILPRFRIDGSKVYN